MMIGDDLERRLASWMQEDAVLLDDLAEVLAQLPQTPQQRHRWSMGTTDLRRRIQSMFTAARVAAFVAIFALGASSALFLAPERNGDLLQVPGAEAPTLDAMARVTWRAWLSKEDPASGTVTHTALGEVIEGSVAEFGIDATDHRLSGTAKYTVNIHHLDPAGGQYPASVMVGTVIVEAADGTWEGTFVGTDYPGTPDGEGQHVLVGTGAYEGLTALMTTHNDKTSGLIFPGDLPDAP